MVGRDPAQLRSTPRWTTRSLRAHPKRSVIVLATPLLLVDSRGSRLQSANPEGSAPSWFGKLLDVWTGLVIGADGHPASSRASTFGRWWRGRSLALMDYGV